MSIAQSPSSGAQTAHSPTAIPSSIFKRALFGGTLFSAGPTTHARFGEDINRYQSDGMNPPTFTKSNIGPFTHLDGDLDIVSVVRRRQPASPFNIFDQVLFHENDLDPALPVITNQPQSQFVTLPATINLAVAALNAETFQWRFNGVDLIDGPGITGATTDTLAVNGTTSSPGVYTCIVTNIAGAVASAPAVIAVPADGAPNPGCNLADIAVPFGVLDLDDIDAFIAAFSAQCP